MLVLAHRFAPIPFEKKSAVADDRPEMIIAPQQGIVSRPGAGIRPHQ
jgi:hypothetical protein